MTHPPDAPVDLDLRLVRYFVAVAEHRHFGRAAAALHVTQPSLSRQIRSLERLLGARLLDRTPQGSRLTAAGEAFLPRAKSVLRSVRQAAAEARAAAEPRRLTVGYTTNLIVTPAMVELRRRHPEADLRTRRLDWSDGRAAVLDGRVDAVVTRMPLSADGLDVVVLHDEPRVLAVPLGHRLAGRPFVTLDDIADEPLPRYADPMWNAFWRVDPRPDGRPAPDGPLVEPGGDKFELVAAGQAVAIIPAPQRGALPRADIAVVELRGVEPSHVVLATLPRQQAGDSRRLVAEFRAVARAVLGSPPGL